MLKNYEELISRIFYNRESLEYGKFKIIKFEGEKGKTKVPYFKIKFKDSSNIIEASLKNIESGKVIDMERKKKETKKRVRTKRKEKKTSRYADRTTLEFKENDVVVLLSLDAASISFGWCISINGEIKDYGYFYISNDKNKLTKRINYMKKEVEKVVKKYKVNACVIEDVINKNIIIKHF